MRTANDNDLKELIKKIQSTDSIAIDVESSSLDPYTAVLLLVQFGFEDGSVYIINAGTTDKEVVRYILQLIADKNMMAIGHNIKFDIKMLYHNYGVLFRNPWDTMLGEVIWQMGLTKPYWGLDELVLKYLGLEMNKDDRDTFIDKTDFVFTEKQLKYAAQDVVVLHPIMFEQKKKIEEKEVTRVWKLECELLPVNALMEYEGVSFDEAKWMELAEKAEKDARQYSKDILNFLAKNFDIIASPYSNAIEAIDNLGIKKDEDGRLFTAKFRREAWSKIITKDEIIANVVPLINLGSPKQCKYILQKLVNKDISSTSEKELQRYKDDPFVSLIMSFRTSFKRATAFGRDFLKFVNPVTKRIHTTYNQLGAATGRYSSDNPNLQNIIAESEYRGCFTAKDGYELMRLDYSQIELRFMAEISGEPKLIKAFQNGDDPHALTGAAIEDIPLEEVTSEIRDKGKHVNFAVIYGTSEYGLNYNFGWPIEQGKLYLDRFFGNYPVLAMFIKLVGLEVIKQGWSTTLLGRKRWFRIPSYKDIGALNRVKRQGVNQIIQGGATADLIKLTILELFKQNPFGWDNFHPLLQVHDEVVVEYREDLKDDAEKFIKRVVEECGKQFLKQIPVKYSAQTSKVWKK